MLSCDRVERMRLLCPTIEETREGISKMSKSSILLFVASATLLAVPSPVHAANVTGHVNLDMELGVGGGRELVIREPAMCDGEGTAKVKWNRNADEVSIKLKLEGVPYQPSYCFEVDPSTPYNQYPPCTLDGGWQVWFTLRMFTRTSVWYYDSASGDLLGNEFDLVGGPPPGSVPVELPAAHMVGSDYFQSNPNNLKVNVTLEFAYEQVLDTFGTPGSIIGILPFNLFDEDSVWIYYTYEILPTEEAQSFDTTLAEIEAGIGGFGVGTSLEPMVKPASLLTHDQLMIGWVESYPDHFLDPLPPEAFDDPDCGTEQIYVPF
jgi:hypothetical protein